MDPLLLAGLLAALVVVPLVLIAFCYLVGRIFSAPPHFGAVLFLMLFGIGLLFCAAGFLRAGQPSQATVTGRNDPIVVTGSRVARQQFSLSVSVPGSGPRVISVPARIFDRTHRGDQIGVRTGSVLGWKLARVQSERITDLVPLGCLIGAGLVVLFTALAATSRRARAPAVLLLLSALIAVAVQPAIEALPPSAATADVTGTVTGVSRVGPSGVASTGLAGYLRGPFSIDRRWMWSGQAPLRFVAVSFTPAGGTEPVTAVDVAAGSAAGREAPIGRAVQVRYLTADPHRITVPGSRAGHSAGILLAVLGGLELLVLLAGVMIWRVAAVRRRRRANRQITLNRDVNQAIALSTRREYQLQPESAAEQTRPLAPVMDEPVQPEPPPSPPSSGYQPF